MPPRPNWDRTRQDLVRLGHRGLEPLAFCRQAATLLRKVVPFDGSCWHTADPASLLITGHYTDLSGEGFPLICANEYLREDVNKFASLAGRRRPVGILAETTRGRPELSARYREIYRPRGWAHELRASFDVGGQTWGSLMLLRRNGRDGYTRREADFVAAVSRQVAQALRVGLLLTGGVGPDPGEPGLVLFAPDGELAASTPSAQQWLAEITDQEPVGPLPASVLAVANRVRGERTAHGLARARVRARSGRLLTLHGTRIGEQVAVIVEPARPTEIAPLVAAAFGLTAREREVLAGVLLGCTTEQIAAELVLSPYTVQDHLKAIFDKTGSRSRRDLAGRIFYQVHAPAMPEHPQVLG